MLSVMGYEAPMRSMPGRCREKKRRNNHATKERLNKPDRHGHSFLHVISRAAKKEDGRRGIREPGGASFLLSWLFFSFTFLLFFNLSPRSVLSILRAVLGRLAVYYEGRCRLLRLVEGASLVGRQVAKARRCSRWRGGKIGE